MRFTLVKLKQTIILIEIYPFNFSNLFSLVFLSHDLLLSQITKNIRNYYFCSNFSPTQFDEDELKAILNNMKLTRN